MCFSASASFIAGTTLCAIGVATLKQTKASAEWLFAMIALLFGIQQLTNGFIWLSFSQPVPVPRHVITYLYSLFSHVVWPIYVPFAIAIMEVVRWLKRVLFAFLMAGVTVGLFLFYWITVGPLIAAVVSHHMVYISPHFYSIPAMILYFTATCISCFFSSHGFVRLLGILSLLIFSHLKIRNRGWGQNNLVIISLGGKVDHPALR